MGYALSAGYAELYEEFLEWQRPRVTPQGLETIRHTVFQLITWLEAQEIRAEELSLQEALEYKAATASRVTKEGTPVSAGTCCNLLKAARVFYRFLVLSGRCETNPFMSVPFPRIGERISRNVLSEAQMNALLERLRMFTNTASYKAHVIAELLYATGLRIAEAASLKPCDIDIRQRLVYVRDGKGGKSRTAFLTGYAALVVEQYLERGRALVLRSYAGPRVKGDTLFCVGFPRLMQEMNAALKEACAALELPAITSHAFRHSLGTHLLRSGCDMRHIQAILGHDLLRTTQIYTHVYKDDLKTSLDAHHPRTWIREAGV
jgi:site-specific recombinase XerD